MPRPHRSEGTAALALALSAALLSSPARAEGPPPPRHGPHLQAALRLYQKLDLDAALAELRLAEDEAKNDEGEMVTTLLYEGLASSESGRTAQAMDNFKRALAISPWAELPEGAPPRIARQFNDARRELWGSGGIKPPPQKKRRALGKATAPAEPPAPLPVPGAKAAAAPDAGTPQAAAAPAAGSGIDAPDAGIGMAAPDAGSPKAEPR